MSKKISDRKTHLLLFVFFTGLFLGINISFWAKADEPVHKYLDYFHNVYQLVKTDYVDVPETKEIFYGAIRGMLKSLDDPFTRFLDEKAYAELREITAGRFYGVGVEISIRDSEVVVIAPIEDSPAMKAGISAGDVIVRVNDEPIKGKSLESVEKMIKGIPGSKVKIFIRREGYDDVLEYDIERAPVRIKSVEYETINDTGTGYIKIKNFGNDTTRDIINALKYFNENKIAKLVLDVRNNPGGLLTSAIEIADLFLDKERVIVSTKGRGAKDMEKTFKAENGPVYKGKVMILVNRGSASASEILSAAIKDNGRGKLIGEKTFGKGSVQKTFNLDENVGIAITVARYYTPSGDLIHKKGITPDYTVQFKELSAEDRAAVRIVEKNRLVDKFVKKDLAYSDETKKMFQEFLKQQNVTISPETANFLLKSGVYRFKKKPLYDLEFDSQLQAALKNINS